MSKNQIKPERRKLNREFLKLKQGQSIVCQLQSYGLKTWIEFDDETGEEKNMSCRTYQFISDKGVLFQMFENGGLKAVADSIEMGKWIELEHEGMEDFTGKDGEPMRVNKYGVFEAQAPVTELKQANG